MYTESKRSRLAALAASFVPHFGAGHQDRVERMDEDVHRVFLFNTELGFNSAEIRFRPALREGIRRACAQAEAV